MPTPRRIAAIDVGTNSIHMIVAELQRRGHRVVDKEKEMVQLGLSSLDGAPLSEDAIQRGVAAITHMAEVARGWEVEEIIAVATSAVREAPNRREFLRRVKEASGVKVRVISGEEEADYIYRAIRSAIDLGGGTSLCVDIGGGSVEFIIATASEIYYTASEPLGSLRLAERFREDVEGCRRFAAGQLRKVHKQVRQLGIDQCIGTSGTIQALASLITPPFTRDALEELFGRLAGTTEKERVERFGIEPKRAATIVAGAAVLLAIMETLSIDSLIVCPAAIREGIIIAQASAKTDRTANALRRTSVLALAQRSDCDRRHARHVAHLASRIFDQTTRLHALPSTAKELLEHAAMLHEVGMHVSDRGYHKHSYYLIRHAALRGFSDDELAVIANVARYHRKSEPDDDHENLAELTAAQRGDVEKLAAILRIAEALDRSHRQAVRDVAVRLNGNVKFFVRARSKASVEIAAAAKRARYFASLFEKKVQFEEV
ncbi:MAG TPA: Ppx/GppA phosphatase family protein [Thermoanaerobaculia bacterium]|jgi:exopolyphosphatase/guanosine-5'-triphosphate,3'-diphosphate pyrophosphatase|nr:Ppx/GppA phosphatase family protein [Thermoanaerobaculia bacterium]